MDYPKSVPGIGLVNGKFVDENTTTGTPGSLIPSTWGNSLTDEVLNVIQAGGLEPSEVARDQLLEAIRALIETRVNDAAALPVGSMVPFPKGVVPPGFLEVNGSVQSVATYPDLAAYLGTTFNTGSEGVGNFRLPESRGEFLRGWDHGRGVDAGRSVGSFQLDAFQGHKLRILTGDGDGHLHSPSGTGGSGTGTSFVISQGTSKELLVGDPISNGLNGEPRFGGETRPRNLSVMWCIKAWSSAISEGVIDIAALALEVQKQKPIAIVGGHKNLALSASGLSAQVSVSADQLIVGAGELVRSLSGVNLSFNGLSVGANGLDAGVMEASSWYSVWVIWNGTSSAGLFSLSETSPKMPSGYSHKARVGWIRTDNTDNKYPLSFIQAGALVQYKVAVGSNVLSMPLVASGSAGSPTSPAWAAVSVLAFVPPTAGRVIQTLSLPLGTSATANAAPNNSYGAYNSSTNPPPFGISASGSIVPSSVQGALVLESSNIYWSSNSPSSRLYIGGWEDNL